MNRRTWSVVLLASALLVVALVTGWALLRADRYLVTCVDVASDVCRQAYEKAADDFRRTSQERIESITVNGDLTVWVCTSAGCVLHRP